MEAVVGEKERQGFQGQLKQNSHLQRLADAGEESILVISNLHDGTNSVVATSRGENFFKRTAEGDAAVCSLAKEFRQFLNTQLDEQLANEKSLESETDTVTEGQFNIISGTSDNSIDETVSKLVQNIFQKTKEKEQSRDSQECYPGFIYRQKRSGRVQAFRNFPFRRNRGGRSFENVCQGSPQSRKENSGSAESGVNTRTADTGVNKMDEAEVIVKKEPLSDEEFSREGTLENIELSQGTGQLQHIGIDTNCQLSAGIKDENSSDSERNSCENKDIEKGNDSFFYIFDAQNGPDNTRESNRNEISKTSKETCLTKEHNNDDSSISSLKVESTGEIDLPFVEEYYQGIDVKSKLAVKLRENGKSELRITKVHSVKSGEPDYCVYKLSPKTGSYNLVVNGYTYIRDKIGKSGTVYWKCGRMSCRGRVIQREDETICSREHNHSP